VDEEDIGKHLQELEVLASDIMHAKLVQAIVDVIHVLHR
jgi:hypothetical protein